MKVRFKNSEIKRIVLEEVKRLYLKESHEEEIYSGELPGLEGPFTTKSGIVLYYDPKQGQYYDRTKDMYLDNDEITQMMADDELFEVKKDLEALYKTLLLHLGTDKFLDEFIRVMNPRHLRETLETLAKLYQVKTEEIQE